MKLSKKQEKILEKGTQKQFDQYEALIENPNDLVAINSLLDECWICVAALDVARDLELKRADRALRPCHFSKCDVCPLQEDGLFTPCVTCLRSAFRRIVLDPYSRHSDSDKIAATKARLAEMVKQIKKNGWEYK